MPGRETFALELDGRQVVVKCMASDSLRERWYERLHTGGQRTPGQREFENLRALDSAGLPVPRALLWARNSSGASLVVMEKIPHREDLEQRLATSDRTERRRLLNRLADLVAELHRAGFYHRDLYLSHIVLREGTDSPVILDVGRLRRESSPRQRWFIKDLAALLHSSPPSIRRTDSLRFLRRYRAAVLGETPSKQDLARFSRAIVQKARRLAAHRPKFADTKTYRAGDDEKSVQP